MNHFETECEDIKDMYYRLTGVELSFGGSRHQSQNSDDDWERKMIQLPGEQSQVVNDNMTEL